MKLSIPLLITIFRTTLVQGNVVSLNPENFLAETAGKAVFIKFFAPWCGHCKSMASDYEKLANTHASDKSKVIAEVDCTAEASQPLCQEYGVQGFPTLKFGDPTLLEDYSGDRSFEAMDKFVKEELKLACSPFALDLCNEEEQQIISKIEQMSDEELAETIAKAEQTLADADEELKQGVEGLQTKFESMMSVHEEQMQKRQKDFNIDLKTKILAMKKKEAGIVDEEDDQDDDFDDDDDDDDVIDDDDDMMY